MARKRSYKRDRKGRFARSGTAKAKRYVKSNRKAISKESARRKRSSNSKRYKGRGAIARSINDYTNSTGYYSKNRRGKNISKTRKKYRKVNGALSKVNVTYAVSRQRGKKVR